MSEELRKAAEAVLKNLDDGFTAEVETGSQFHYWLQDALAQPAAVQGWRPIESAPKDGTWFIGACFNEVPHFDQPLYEVGRFDPLTFPKYEPAGEGLYRRVDEVVHEWAGFNNMPMMSHWHPLPQPPEAESRPATEMGHRSSGPSAQTECQEKGSSAMPTKTAGEL